MPASPEVRQKLEDALAKAGVSDVGKVIDAIYSAGLTVEAGGEAPPGADAESMPPGGDDEEPMPEEVPPDFAKGKMPMPKARGIAAMIAVGKMKPGGKKDEEDKKGKPF